MVGVECDGTGSDADDDAAPGAALGEVGDGGGDVGEVDGPAHQRPVPPVGHERARSRPGSRRGCGASRRAGSRRGSRRPACGCARRSAGRAGPTHRRGRTTRGVRRARAASRSPRAHLALHRIDDHVEPAAARRGADPLDRRRPSSGRRPARRGPRPPPPSRRPRRPRPRCTPAATHSCTIAAPSPPAAPSTTDRLARLHLPAPVHRVPRGVRRDHERRPRPRRTSSRGPRTSSRSRPPPAPGCRTAGCSPRRPACRAGRGRAGAASITTPTPSCPDT